MSQRAGLLAVLTLFLTSAHAQERPRPELPAEIELPNEVDRVLRDYETGWRSSDSAGLAALFTPEGFILRPGNPPVRGRANIEEAYRGSGGSLILTAYDYAVDDSVGYIIGGFRYSPEGADLGKYTLTLRKLEDGRWYIQSDMDNSNRR
jgi:ketosteroid isomerase-like protein